MLGLSESFFQGSPFNSSNDSSFGIEWRKKNNLNQQNQSRTFSPASRFVKSPNISPIIKKMDNLTIAEEPDDSGCDKTYIVSYDNPIHGINSPRTPINRTFIIDQNVKFRENIAEKKIFIEKKSHRRRTMFLIPPTPTTIKDNSKLNKSDFEHQFTVDTILKEIGMTKYANLFEREEVNLKISYKTRNKFLFLTD